MTMSNPPLDNDDAGDALIQALKSVGPDALQGALGASGPALDVVAEKHMFDHAT